MTLFTVLYFVAPLLLALLVGWIFAKLASRHYHGAMAVCVQCEHTTARMELANAVKMAKRHKAGTGHPCMVVKG